MPSFRLPAGYARIKIVGSFEELLATPFTNGVNALCWARELPGDFGEIVRCLGAVEDITAIDESDLNALELSAAGKRAVQVLLEDQRFLRECGLAPGLDCIPGYPRDAADAVLPTDVYSFHADRAPIAADTYLCTYAGAPSEGLRNDQARRHVDIAETRAALLQLSGHAEGAGFDEYLRESCYDLHYAALPGAEPFSFGSGNMWRIAIEHPDSHVPPCLHRAPKTVAGEAPRLLLIS